MSETYCYLRNVYEGEYDGEGDNGRAVYAPGRTDDQVYTHGDRGYSRRWRMVDWGSYPGSDTKSIVTLEATDTARPGMPDNPDISSYWSHAPLPLVARENGEVHLVGNGDGLPDSEDAGKWIAERVERTTPAGVLTCLTLESYAFRGRRLAHKRDESGGLRVPQLYQPLMIHSQDASGGYWTDRLWWIEPAPAPVPAARHEQTA